MGMTNFPQGVSSFGIPMVGAGPILTIGDVYFVNNNATNASDGNVGSVEKPLYSLAGALAKVTANHGDVILIASGHTEVLTSALDFNKAGVTIIGMGNRATKPTIKTTTSTGARLLISVANVRMANLRFLSSIDASAGSLWLSSADDFHISDCDFVDDTSCQATTTVYCLSSKRVIFERVKWYGDNAAGGGAALAIAGGTYFELRDFYISGNYSVGAIDIRSIATTRLWIHDGLIKTYNSADIAIVDTITASTGQIGPNLYLDLTDNAANITEAITGATFRVFDNVYVVNADNEKAMLINWTASADA